VRTVQDRLSDYVREVIKQKRLNYREVARRSRGQISHSTIGDIINRRTRNVKADTLVALARGLKVPQEELLAIAFGTKAEDNDFERSYFARLYNKSKKLQGKDRTFIQECLEVLEREIDRRL
jgi:transcriptional regulator with XRE-family HTH domain